MTLLVPATARRPSRLIVDTEAVGVDLRQLLGVPAGTIDVVPLGPRLDPVADATPEVELRACSDAPSPPELARDAAHRFDPRSTAAIAETVRRLLADPELRMHLACGGRTRVRRFSWERAAAETVAVYRHALAG